MTRTKIIAIAVGLALAAGLAAFWFLRGSGGPAGSLSFTSLAGLLSGGSEESATDPRTDQREIGGAPAEAERYVDPTYGFSFELPPGAKAASFAEESGDMVLVQGAADSNADSNADATLKSASDQRTDQRAISGFQIYITPFDEPGPITLERIRKDLPTLVMEEPQQVTIALKSEIPNPKSETNPNDSNSKSQTNGVPVLVFFSRGESFGRTREVWFIWPPDPVPHGNYLYQITAPAEFDQELSRIMGTWIFR